MHGIIVREVLIASLALVVTAWAGWLDWRSRRIPNWLTVSGLCAGLLANGLAWGWAGAWGSAKGAGLGLGLLLPFVLLRGLGAGDWKLVGALGAILQVRNMLLILVGAIFIGGIMAVVEIIRKRRVVQTLKNLWTLMRTFIFLGLSSRDHLKVSLDNSSLLTLPFGVAVALATVLFFCASSAFRIF